MVEFFPPGFWKTVAMLGMILFFILGADLLAGARLTSFLSRTLNRRYQVDQAIAKVLANLQKSSDREYDVDRSMLAGWGRFVISGLLFFGAAMLLLNVMPRL